MSILASIFGGALVLFALVFFVCFLCHLDLEGFARSDVGPLIGLFVLFTLGSLILAWGLGART